MSNKAQLLDNKKKLEAAMSSTATPEAFKGKLKDQLDKVNKSLDELEAAEQAEAAAKKRDDEKAEQKAEEKKEAAEKKAEKVADAASDVVDDAKKKKAGRGNPQKKKMTAEERAAFAKKMAEAKKKKKAAPKKEEPKKEAEKKAAPKRKKKTPKKEAKLPKKQRPKQKRTKRKTKSESITAFLKRNKVASKKYKGTSGENKKKDAQRGAKPFGYRLKGKGNYRKPTREEIRSGKAYWEGRASKADVKRTSYPKLEQGGALDNIVGDPNNPELLAGGEMFGKGGTLKKKANYLPSREIESVTTWDGVVIDGKNLLDGLYIKKGVKFAKGGFLFGGSRPKSATARDRAYKSDESHEKRYKRKKRPVNPRYKK